MLRHLFWLMVSLWTLPQGMGLPSLTEEAVQTDKEIFAGYSPPPRLEGVTLAAGNGVLASGTVLGRITASEKYAPYNDLNADGTETAVCILRAMVDTTGADDKSGEGVFSGVLKNDQLVGLDAAAIADLGGRQDTVRNIFQF